jgi:SAM-dependent methyltransferase
VYDERYTDYQRRRGRLRRLVRRVYLAHAAGLCRGRVLDFGCGIGALLERLPAGSLGLEVNAASVAYCRSRGLNVALYDPETDGYTLRDLPIGQFETLIASHVLEHLEQPDEALRLLFGACNRLGITRVVIIVPGPKGFASDSTHRTFVDEAYLRERHLLDVAGWRRVCSRRFPLDKAWFGRLFTHNELSVVWEKTQDYQ